MDIFLLMETIGGVISVPQMVPNNRLAILFQPHSIKGLINIYHLQFWGQCNIFILQQCIKWNKSDVTNVHIFVAIFHSITV